MADEEEAPPEPTSDLFRFVADVHDGVVDHGDTYEGEFETITPELQEGEEEPAPPYTVRSGKGKAVSTEGYTYEGGFSDEVFHGEGTLTYKSGASYSGSWDKGKYHGKGKFTWADGSSYEGDWVQDVMHGQGTYTDKAGKANEGQFYNGVGPGFGV